MDLQGVVLGDILIWRSKQVKPLSLVQFFAVVQLFKEA